MERFEVDLLTKAAADLVAWLVPGSRLFGWMARSLVVPAGWIALVTRAGRDAQLIASGQRYEDEDTQDVLFLRTGPQSLEFTAPGLISSDKFGCDGYVSLHVRPVEELLDVVTFRRNVVGSSDQLKVADLQRHIEWEVRRAMADYAREHTAAQLVNELDLPAITKLIKDRIGPVCLSTGLAVDGPIAVRFDSPPFRDHCTQQAAIADRHRRVEARAQIQQALAEAQKERLSHLVGLLEQLQNKAAEFRNDISIERLIAAFDESQRAELYSAMWHLGARTQRTALLAVISGSSMLFFGPADLKKPARQVELPDTLGPLRSVCVDAHSSQAGLIMIGARTGVFLVEIASGGIVGTLSANQLAGCDLRGGVNAVAMSPQHIYATHSEIGLLSWPRKQGSAMAERLLGEVTRKVETLRCARFDAGLLWFAADRDLWSMSEDTHRAVRYVGSRDRISAVATAPSVVYAGNVEGQILAWDIGDFDAPRTIRGATGHPVESITPLEAGGIDHLMVADRSTALQAITLEDHYVRRYEARSLAVRRASVAEDLFVAMNDNRDRLIAWDPRQPAEPAGITIIPHLTGETMQDLCLIPAREAIG